VERLAGLAGWMRTHGEALHGTSASPFEGAPFRATRRDRTLYCFLPEWPAGRELLLPGVRTRPEQATMLGQRTRDLLPTRVVDAGVVVTVPERASDPTCSVLAVRMHEAVPAAY
jgi:alpha-L-fucosidase